MIVGDIYFELFVKDNKLIFEFDGMYEGYFEIGVGWLEEVFGEKVLMVCEENVKYFGSPITFLETDISELVERDSSKKFVK